MAPNTRSFPSSPTMIHDEIFFHLKEQRMMEHQQLQLQLEMPELLLHQYPKRDVAVDAAPITSRETRQEEALSASSSSSSLTEETLTPPTREAKPPVVEEEEEEAPSTPDIMTVLLDEQWDTLQQFCEDDSSIASQSITMVCQGENSVCLPIHFASGRKSTPQSTFETLVQAHPSSLLQAESIAGRLPLHMAVWKGASVETVKYLCEAMPESLKVSDQEGNLPLHYAAMYSADAIVSLLVELHPEACRAANQSERLPLHLLVARCWSKDAITKDTIQNVVELHPEACRLADRRGRLPLHICCSSDARADVLQLLVSQYPEALLATDTSKLIPLDAARKFTQQSSMNTTNGSSNVVHAYLMEMTNKERRKKYKFLAPFQSVGTKLARRRASRQKAQIEAVQLHYCYG